MNINEITFLPGLNKQLKFLLNKIEVKDKSILIVGSNTERIARKLLKETEEIIIIVDDQEDQARMRFNLSDERKLTVRYMEFSNTDFINKKFDIVYAQGSVSRNDRNKILKEFKKLLKPNGILCVGEIVSLTNNPPQFVKDVWDQSGISPLALDKINNYYEGKRFKIIDTIDLTDTFKEFYSLSKQMIEDSSINFSKDDMKLYKHALNRMKHEADIYLKLGGDKHIGFKSLLLRHNTE